MDAVIMMSPKDQLRPITRVQVGYLQCCTLIFFVIRDWLNVSNLTKKLSDTVHPFANQLSSNNF